MKKRSFILALSLTSFLFSCSKKEDNFTSKTDESAKILKSLSETPRSISGSIDSLSFPFFTTIEKEKMDILAKQFSSKALEWIGPNYVNGDRRLVYENSKMILRNDAIPDLPTGIYFCDVYSHNKRVALPSNSVARIEPMEQVGFTNPTGLERGVNYTQSTGSTFDMTTYTIVVKYNLIGQSINLMYPYDGNTITFAYSYLLY